MLKALLLDLDDTLLVNPMEPFIRAYFQALGAHMAHLVPPERLLEELMRGSRALEANTGAGLTNDEQFRFIEILLSLCADLIEIGADGRHTLEGYF